MGISMLFIMINWLYVLITTFCLGYAFSRLAGKLFGYRIKSVDGLLMAGLGAATVYAQFFSLFYRVSLLANVMLVIFSAMTVLFWHQDMKKLLAESFRGSSRAVKILIPVLFVLWGYFTSRGYMVHDTKLYHAQSIRWIEEYGIVPGQGVVNSRFSYNSSVFSLAALYSLKFVFGQSMHAMSGWFAFLLSMTTLDIIKGVKKLRLSDFANVAAIYYLTLITDEVLAPSSDYATMCVLFFLLIKWLRLLEQPKEEQQTAPYGLLCVLGVYALTLKLTAGLILMLLIKPAYRLLKEKQWKQILGYLFLGILTAAPWLIRGVLISGWLLYPFPALDLFDLPWKQKTEWVKTDAGAIKTWGRGVNNSALAAQPIWEWYSTWFKTLSLMEKGIALVDIAALVSFVGAAIAVFLRKSRENLDRLLVCATVACSYLYWQTSAPLPRYGYTYMLLLPALVFGWGILLLKKDRLLRGGLALYGVYKIVMLISYIAGCAWYPAYIRQVDYYSADTKVWTVEVDGVEFYCTEEDGIGYAYFPASSAYEEFRLRGNGLKDGFEWVNPE